MYRRLFFMLQNKEFFLFSLFSCPFFQYNICNHSMLLWEAAYVLSQLSRLSAGNPPH